MPDGSDPLSKRGKATGLATPKPERSADAAAQNSRDGNVVTTPMKFRGVSYSHPQSATIWPVTHRSGWAASSTAKM